MKKTILILIIILAIPASSYAWERAPENRWTMENTLWEGFNVIVQTIDWGQSYNIVNNPDRYYETNKLLGPHPSKKEVDKFFITSIVGHAVISYVLPKDYRQAWQLITLGMHIENAGKNYAIGLRVDF